MTISMQVRYLFALLLSSIAVNANSAETFQLRISDLLQSERAQKFLDPAVKLYWGDEATPALQEIARPDVNTGISLSGGLFSAGSREHCVAAFENALDAMIRSARSAGFDTVVNIRVGQGKKPAIDAQGFNCTPGYRTTDVRLWSSFAMTPAAAQRFAEAERQLAQRPAREPAKGAIFLPITSVLASPELKKILGRHVRAYWGVEAPEYDERTNSPEEYSEDVEIGGLSREEACRQATLKTLEAMVKEARKEDFDSIVRIRSYHNEQFTPIATDIECELAKKTASVTLRAYLANRK
jgi:uncharacterized protein YbjQ (UPF0145 family)